MSVRNRFFTGLSLAAFGTAGVPMSKDAKIAQDLFEGMHRQRRGKGKGNRRGKGARSRPKARPNMRLVSKRVRRKHRRAKAA